MAAPLSDKEKRLQLRRFAYEEGSRDNTVEPLAILHQAKVDIPLVLSGRSRDSNIKLIKGELGRVGQPFREKFSRNRKGKMTPELRAQIECLFAENPYGVSYQSVVTGLKTHHDVSVSKTLVGTVVKQLRAGMPSVDASPPPPTQLGSEYNRPPTPFLNDRELAALAAKAPTPPAPYELCYSGILTVGDPKPHIVEYRPVPTGSTISGSNVKGPCHCAIGADGDRIEWPRSDQEEGPMFGLKYPEDFKPHCGNLQYPVEFKDDYLERRALRLEIAAAEEAKRLAKLKRDRKKRSKRARKYLPTKDRY